MSHATIAGLARRLGVSWKTLWPAIEPDLVRLSEDPSRFDGVTSLGVDEHIWHHVDTRRLGPKELTGMVDLTRDDRGRVRARLLDLVPGRSKRAYADWLQARTPAFRDGVRVAALDPFAGYKSAIDDELDDAVAVPDAFHVVKLGTQVVDEVRRRVQQDTLGHRGRKGDPLYGIQTILRAGAEHLTEKQLHRLAAAIGADPAHEAVYVAWRCAQDLRAAYREADLAEGRRRAEKILESFHTCPIPGRTARTDAAPLARRVPGLLHDEPLIERRHRGDQRHHRAPPPPRPRLPQPTQLPAPHAPRCRRPHPVIPTGCPKTPICRLTIDRFRAMINACFALD